MMKNYRAGELWKILLLTFVFVGILVLATPKGTTLWLQGGGFQVHLIKNPSVLQLG